MTPTDFDGLAALTDWAKNGGKELRRRWELASDVESPFFGQLTRCRLSWFNPKRQQRAVITQLADTANEAAAKALTIFYTDLPRETVIPDGDPVPAFVLKAYARS